MVAVPSAVLHASSTSLPTAPDRVTVNSTTSPSVALAAATDTVSMPGSVIVVVADAAVASTVTVPAVVVASLSVTVSVSPESSTPSVRVGIEIVPVASPRRWSTNRSATCSPYLSSPCQ